MARVYSFWIFDRHCNPIYHQDWSHLYAPSSSASISASTSAGGPGSPTTASSSSGGLASIGATLQRASGAVTGSSTAAAASASGNAAAKGAPSRSVESSLPGVTRAIVKPAPVQDQRSSTGSQIAASQAQVASASDALPFDEEAKLVYGVVFSLRNMVRKLGGNSESFNSYTTSTYTLAHLHTPTMYTFVILSDPVPPPSSIPSRSSDGYSIGTPTATGRSGFGTGGGIPGTGGMSLKGVLMQIYRGPWVEHVARNPLLTGLEREAREVEAIDGDEAEDDDVGDADPDAFVARLRVLKDGKLDRSEGVDSDAFRDGIERVLAQNKLSAPPSATA
ncbi:uncharacterized protein PFL1_03070 [Pseudozyma flocculosa PF-1]|uniref:Trafficking protein particle complex subunit n=1 Tax=Pseudozyma flocculosa PF-1 TaxID=1277687 RepID=A0A061HBA6_9BASI|nr:uncharacterized protein PFL1_03070 [Pseudozyma flocculosa PF-1]EPQ29315.1 hypothetical protein PFL1_03070 [Pseudozyma flocculosa PF-1]